MKKGSSHWETMLHPGYLGSRKAEITHRWDEQYGVGNWRISWETKAGKPLSFEDIFAIYVEGYQAYFEVHKDEALYLTNNFAYAYDIDVIPKEGAFDKYYAFEQLHRPNQFHHVALNIALRDKLHLPFLGDEPIQARGGKPGTSENSWPAGWKWHPGRIPSLQHELIPRDIEHENQWWDDNSIEDVYQSTKVLQIKLT